MIRFIPALAALAGYPTAWASYHTVFHAIDGLLESLDEEAYIALRGGIGAPRSRPSGRPSNAAGR